MFYRIWDVYAATSHYLSTDFVVCDSKGTMMHDTARSAITHNFLKLKEDVVGYVTNVGRTVQQKTGSKTLDFHLANSRGQSVRATPWGSIGELLIKKRTSHVGVYLIALTCLTVKQYNSEKRCLVLNLVRKCRQWAVQRRKPGPWRIYLCGLEIENMIYRLELEVLDDIAEVVMVMFNDTATSLVKCTTDSIVEYEDQILS
ncbi:hypothetical protein Tco_1234366 [Tanacetum coccineum]